MCADTRYPLSKKEFLLAKLNNLQVSYQLEQLKRLPVPDECLILDDYATLEVREELKMQIQDTMNDIESMLVSQAPILVSNPLHDAIYTNHVLVAKQMASCADTVLLQMYIFITNID